MSAVAQPERRRLLVAMLEELVEKGFLRRDGIGFYELVEGK